MNVIFKNVKDVLIENIHFLDKKKNNIINNGYFVKILYFDKNVSINGLLILYDDNDSCVTNALNLFEYQILNHYMNEIQQYNPNTFFNKTIVYNLSKFFKKNGGGVGGGGGREDLGNILWQPSFYKNNISGTTASMQKKNYETILKISGIWETETEIGITFKSLKM